MVALCAGCNAYEPWAALVVGFFAGLSFIGVHYAMLAGQLDDPLDAVAVHGGGGICGLFCVPFFMNGTGIFWTGADPQVEKDRGNPGKNRNKLKKLLSVRAWAP